MATPTVLIATHAREAEMMRRAMERAGLRVVVANAREPALEKIGEERPAAVVISARFATGPVDQLVDAVREAGLERVRVVLVDDPSAHPRRVGHSGADVLLLRPVDPSVLVQKLAQFVETHAFTPVPPPADLGRVRAARAMLRFDETLPGFDALLPELDASAFAAPQRRSADVEGAEVVPSALLRIDAEGLGVDPLAEAVVKGRLASASLPLLRVLPGDHANGEAAPVVLDADGLRTLLRRRASTPAERRELIAVVRDALGLEALAGVAAASDENRARSTAPAIEVTGTLERARVESKAEQVREADYFALLEVGRDAAAEEIDAAWKRLRAEFVPERCPADRRAELAPRLREIAEVLDEAHRVLSDPTVRLAYRTHLEA